MADITESMASPAQHASLPSLTASRTLSTQRATDGQADTAEMARVAADLLTDARRLRGLHGEKIVVAPSGSPEHELHVNLHACERAALAAQRRGVEALTARLRNDADLLASISAAALTDLEASARSLLGASSLSDQLLAADASSDGGPPPPPTLADGELVVDLTGDAADVEVRPASPPDLAPAEELDDAASSLASANWEARRAAILERVERARRPEPEPEAGSDLAQVIEPVRPLRSEDVSPIVAAALAAPSLRSAVVDEQDVAESERAAVAEEIADAEEALVDVGEAPADIAVDGDETRNDAPDAEDDDEVVPIESRLGDVSTADAVVIDIADAPSAARSDEDDGDLADVIELQTEATLPEWPIWKGPDRSIDSDVVPVPAADLTVPALGPDAVDPPADDYPRLVSVAPAEPEPATEPVPDSGPTLAEQAKGPVFSFAPAAPTDDLLPVPVAESTHRKTQEEIAAEARALIADNKADSSDSFSPREVRRRQRRLRSHQRAVEKAENRNQRDRRRAELEHERTLAEDAPDTAPAYAPTWFAQLAFAIAICLLVVMVAVGLWFLLAEDPGLF